MAVSSHQYYVKLKLLQGTDPLVFTLEALEQVDRTANSHDASYDISTRELDLPILRLPDGSLYQATLDLVPGANPAQFELKTIEVTSCS